jgi:5-methylcytosine-specific restriction endonuclease McrA
MKFPKHKPIRLKGKALKALRESAYQRDLGRCVKCDKPLPLYGDIFTRAHLSHIKSRGAGGGDTLENTQIKCYQCHIVKEHCKGGVK